MAAVAAVVLVGHVVVGPQGLVRGHRHERVASGPGHTTQLRQRGAVVARVLDHVEAGDEVEAGVLPGQALDGPHPHVVVAPGARRRHRLGAQVETGHPPVSAQLVE